MKNNDDFSKKLLNKIKEDNIKQTPKNIFIFRNILVWFFLVFSIILGAISLSISFEYLINADWNLITKIGFIKIFTIFMPFFWILFLVLASFFSYYNFKHTEKGYKFNFYKILGINIFLSFFLGFIIYIIGINTIIEGQMESRIPKYRENFVANRETRMIKVWQNEDKGLLIGEVIRIKNSRLDLIDYNSKKWDIILNDNTNIAHKVIITNGAKIKIIGKIINDNIFIANEVRPFKRSRK